MTIGEGLRAYLLGDTSIAALVSARAFPLRLPQKAVMPAITYLMVSDVRPQHLRGTSGRPNDRFQIDAWAATHDGAVALGALIRQRLDGFTGEFQSAGSPVETIEVSGAFWIDGRDLFEEEILGGLCRHSADYRLVYRSVN